MFIVWWNRQQELRLVTPNNWAPHPTKAESMLPPHPYYSSPIGDTRGQNQNRCLTTNNIEILWHAELVEALSSSNTDPYNIGTGWQRLTTAAKIRCYVPKEGRMVCQRMLILEPKTEWNHSTPPTLSWPMTATSCPLFHPWCSGNSTYTTREIGLQLELTGTTQPFLH